MNHTITARRLLTDIGSVEYPVLTIQDGLIVDIFSDPIALSEEKTTLAATFLDVHTHGAMGHDVMRITPTQLSEMQRFLAARGVGQYLPTTVTASVDDTLRALEILADAIDSDTSDNEAEPIGIHLEGPFLSHAKRGVHAPELLQRPSVELFDRFHLAARGHIRLMTIAPEPDAAGPQAQGVATNGDAALELIRHATKLGVRCSLGHSNALSAQALAGVEAGAVSATHTFNAMRPLDHREPGILGTVLTDDRLYAEIVCDGVHVAPSLVPLWWKAKGPQRGILITDAMSAAGMPDGEYELAGYPVTVAEGKAVLRDAPQTLAGSVLTMDRAVENMQRFTGVGLGDAVRAASHTPAAMLGIPERTRLAPGSPANLNRFGSDGRLIETYLSGKRIAS